MSLSNLLFISAIETHSYYNILSAQDRMQKGTSQNKEDYIIFIQYMDDIC